MLLGDIAYARIEGRAGLRNIQQPGVDCVEAAYLCKTIWGTIWGVERDVGSVRVKGSTVD